MTLKNCETCGNTADWHAANNPRHPFNDGTVPGSEIFGVKLPGGGRGPVGSVDGVETALTLHQQTPQWPFDPVLRQALIDKGVLTPDDLSEAERKIRAVTAQFTQGGQSNVQSTT
jgi:hypothetical protein